jgi:hypothetical protein
MQRRATAATALLLSLGSCSSDPLLWQGGPTSAHLLAYKDAFAAAVGSACTASLSFRDFAGAARQSRVLWLGDDHRDALLHEQQTELLRRFGSEGLQPVLLLEAIGEGDQDAVARYLQCRIDMSRLRQECRGRWPDSWLDDGDVDAPFYRQLLQDARSRGWPVQALEPTPRLPLQQRDAYIKVSVQRAAAQHPDKLLVVVIGQTHLLGEGDLAARTALPSLVLAATPPVSLLPPADALPAAAMFVRTDRGVLFFASRVGGPPAGVR